MIGDSVTHAPARKLDKHAPFIAFINLAVRQGTGRFTSPTPGGNPARCRTTRMSVASESLSSALWSYANMGRSERPVDPSAVLVPPGRCRRSRGRLPASPAGAAPGCDAAPIPGRPDDSWASPRRAPGDGHPPDHRTASWRTSTKSRYKAGGTSIPGSGVRRGTSRTRRAPRGPVLLGPRRIGVRVRPGNRGRVITGQDLGHRSRVVSSRDNTSSRSVRRLRNSRSRPGVQRSPPARRPPADRAPPATTPSPPPRPRPGTRRRAVRPQTAPAHGITSSL